MDKDHHKVEDNLNKEVEDPRKDKVVVEDLQKVSSDHNRDHNKPQQDLQKVKGKEDRQKVNNKIKYRDTP